MQQGWMPETLISTTNRRRPCQVAVSSLKSEYGDVLVSTGVWKPDKRAAVCPVCVKRDTLNINAKRTNNFALAA